MKLKGMKIITGIKGDILSVNIGDVDYVGKDFGFINFYDSKINKEDFEIDEETYIKQPNGLVKFKDVTQFNLIPTLISRLFCYIDDKNNILLSSEIVGMQYFGNLHLKDNQVLINKSIVYDDLKSMKLNFIGDTLHCTSYFDIIEGYELDVLKYILRFNRPENMENLYVGYVNIPNEYIFTTKEVEDESYDKYKVGCIITKKLYNSPTSIKIIGKINSGNIYDTTMNVKNIITNNNITNNLL